MGICGAEFGHKLGITRECDVIGEQRAVAVAVQRREENPGFHRHGSGRSNGPLAMLGWQPPCQGESIEVSKTMEFELTVR